MGILGSPDSDTHLRAAMLRLEASLADTRALHRVTSSLIDVHDVGTVLQVVVDSVAQALPADRVALITFDRDAQAVTHFVTGGPGADAIVQVSFDELAHGLTGWVLREQQPALSLRSALDAREDGDVQQRRRDTQCGDIIVVPLRYRDTMLGTLTAINDFAGAAFAERHVALMTAMAGHAAVAIATAGLYDTLQREVAAHRLSRDRAMESLRHNQLIIESIASILIGISPAGRIVHWNPAASKCFGLQAREVLGQPIERIGIGWDWPLLQAEIAARVSTHRSGELTDITYRRPDGSDGVLTLRLSVVTGARQDEQGYLLIGEDASDKRRLEAQARRSQKLESIGRLAAGVAHDFNNILTEVLGSLSLLDPAVARSSDEERLLANALAGTRRAGTLSKQLLTFATGGAPMRSVSRIGDLIRESASFASRGSPFRVDFDIAPELWDANADRDQIGQVMHNLILNAIESMPTDGSLRITAHNRPRTTRSNSPLPAGDYVAIVVADTGAGIPAEHLARVFDPDFSTKPNRHGLGLATVQSIISRHHGAITVDSNVGRGTVVTFWIPAVTSIAHAVTPPSVATVPTADDRPRRVLFLDDEPTILAVAQRLVARMGYEFASDVDGEALVATYRAAYDAGRPYDVVVLDLTIPGGMGGKEVISRLIAIDPAVRAIVSSGYSSDPVMAEFAAYGFRAVVPKPYDVATMQQTIRSVLASPPRTADIAQPAPR